MKKLPSPTKTAWGLTLFILLLFLTCAGYLLYTSARHDRANMTAEIYQDGILKESIPLWEVETPYLLTVTGQDNAVNVIRISAEGIEMVQASCPDKICVHQGFVDHDLLPITCLPNRLVIVLVREGGDSRPQMDAVTY